MDSSKGIGASNPPPHSAVSTDNPVTGKSNQKTVRPAKAKNRIPPAKSTTSQSSAAPLEKDPHTIRQKGI